MKKRRVYQWVLLSLTMVLVSCFRDEIKVKDIGVMQYREYTRYEDVFFEQGTTHLKEEICPPSGVGCVSAQQLRYKESNGSLWVGIEERFKLETPSGTYFFDTKTGNPLACLQCAMANKVWGIGVPIILDGGKKFVFVTTYADRQGAVIAERKSNIIQLSFVIRPPFVANITHFFGPYINRQKTSVAWYECARDCNLYWLSNFTEIKTKPTGCDSEYLEVYWKEGEPEIGEFTNLTDRLRCHDAAGNLRFPLVKRSQVRNPH